MTTDEKVVDEITQTRLVVYDFLRRVFLHEPTEEFFRLLDESGLLDELSDLPGVKNMLSCVRTTLAGDGINDVRQDFYQLFLGPRHLKAPPWESVYRSELRLVNQKCTVDVRKIYSRFGFETEGGQLEDHFGTECDFIYRLCLMSDTADEEQTKNLLSVQKYFITEHLAMWAPRFVDDIKGSARTLFFRGLAQFVDYWIHKDQEFLSDAV